MKPYFEDPSGITIYHGSALSVLDGFRVPRATMLFDLLLTDPPYGIGEAAGKNKTRIARTSFGGKRTGPPAIPHDYGVSDWDDATQEEELSVARRMCRWQAVFGGNYYDLPPSRCWLVWDKDNTGDFADCELVWTNFDKAVRKLTYRWNGMLQEPGCARDNREHPTQKPEAVMRWALLQAPPDVRTVLDPFMGSGTTLVACKRLGRSCVGIEREEKYCEIAAKRLQQGALDLALDERETEPTQTIMEGM